MEATPTIVPNIKEHVFRFQKTFPNIKDNVLGVLGRNEKSQKQNEISY